jgi:superfamily II DNA or RNA helicase/t-SNARE complex subunit (syntaxin)
VLAPFHCRPRSALLASSRRPDAGTPPVDSLPLTDYHAKYLAYELTRRFSSDSIEKLTSAVAGAQVDLNPHQVDAALFAFRSPLSRGALLADEVGLGKTIEAGLVLAQRWAERKRRILVIAPANLRKQWHQELAEKFFLPAEILEAKPYNAAIKAGNFQPFEPKNAIVICSYQFARSKATDLARIPWDLVVIDEAHRLRNAWKPGNVIASTLKTALANRQKLLLTATPLQNSLLELFGLVSIIDEHAFGDIKSFREQFVNLSQQQVFATLKSRLRPICHRTLRRQVTQYISYTRRLPIVEEFTPDETEDRLYSLVSEYLQRENLQALPASQRTLMTLVLRKLLASSTFAIAGALTSIADRLRLSLADRPQARSLADELDEDFEALDEVAEEWPDDDGITSPVAQETRRAIEKEIADLQEFAELARSITHNAKARSLLKALKVAFAKAKELGAAEKAIIFTESRRTQDYLLRVLADSEYAEGVLLFNGSNTDDHSRRIYSAWLDANEGTDRITGSKTADMRSALVDYFRNSGRIMIATEAGAEGINLQFCSLVVNYDLPWNPQRIEQRIGRCHRYGQKHDVVVVNFLNRKNEADRRVFELLSEKFALFEGVFGASDEVLGAIESGVDFERRIATIYQQCRKPEEIRAAFDALQTELSLEINDAMTQTRRKLLENFDDEVRERLKTSQQTTQKSLNRVEAMLMRLTNHELRDCANFESASEFELYSTPSDIPSELAPLGRYELPRRSGNAHLYRPNHPLAEALYSRAKERELTNGTVQFQYAPQMGKISALDPLIGKQGWLSLSCCTIQSLDQAEDRLIFSAILDDGSVVDSDAARKMFRLDGVLLDSTVGSVSPHLASDTQHQQAEIQQEVSERNAKFFEAEAVKLDGWADDLKVGLEREIKELDREIKEARRSASGVLTLDEKLAGQRKVKALESVRNNKRRSLFEEQDRIDAQRETLIAEIERKMEQQIKTSLLFQIRWSIDVPLSRAKQ